MILRVGLAAWIIQDGNYGEFESGSRYRFALEFYPSELVGLNEAPDPAIVRGTVGAEYEVRAKVIRVTNSHWVIDFGLPAFQESKPPSWAVTGAGVTGRVYLGIDPFFYFERLKNESGMPDLFRIWQVRRILLETTPWRETTDLTGRSVSTREDVAPMFREVPCTDSWKDDGGHAHYILECELLEN